MELNKSFRPEMDAARLDQVLKKAASLPGINRVIPSAEFPVYGLPRYEDDPHIPGHYMIVANIDQHLVVDPTSSSMSSGPMKNAYHGYGYLPSHPRMYPALILGGRGINKGKQLGHVHNLNVAPTIAHLLGLKMEGTSGRILKEVLSTP